MMAKAHYDIFVYFVYYICVKTYCCTYVMLSLTKQYLQRTVALYSLK